jgi:hypothetical protein
MNASFCGGQMNKWEISFNTKVSNEVTSVCAESWSLVRVLSLVLASGEKRRLRREKREKKKTYKRRCKSTTRN